MGCLQTVTAIDANNITTAADTHHLGRMHEGYSGVVNVTTHSIVRCGADMLPAVDALLMHLS